MMTKMFLNFKSPVILFLLLLPSTHAMADPVVVFDNGFDWKQIFDSGLRPRHKNGGRNSCKIWNQPSFILQIKGLDGQMHFGAGHMTISFDYKEKISGFTYFDNEPIDMAEGAKRVEQLTKWLKPYIIHEMQMPRYIEGTYVDANVSNARLVAQMGEYRFSYQFVDTASPTKQLRGEFSVYHAFPGKIREGITPVDRKIKPPPGYEDWDMTEIIPTSNGDKRVEDVAVTPVKKIPADSPHVPREERDRLLTSPPDRAEIIKQKPFFSVGIIMGLLAVILSFLYASKQRRKK